MREKVLISGPISYGKGAEIVPPNTPFEVEIEEAQRLEKYGFRRVIVPTEKPITPPEEKSEEAVAPAAAPAVRRRRK